MPLRAYLGCSNPPFHPQHHELMDSIGDGWVYIDKFVKGTERGQEILPYDVEDLPYLPESIDTIYNSHLLEHIPYIRVPKMLKHWYSLLKPGGKLIVNCPDLEWVCREYLKLLQMERDGEGFNYQNSHYHWTHNWDVPGNSFIQMFYGSQQHEGEYHLSGYSKESLTKALETAGFRDITVFPAFEAHLLGCLIAEAVK